MTRQLTMPGVQEPYEVGDALERVYTPDALALAATREIDETLDQRPRRLLEAHVGGGAWVRAARVVWGNAVVILAVDVDVDATGLAIPELAAALVGDVTCAPVLEQVVGWQPDWIVGNPPFADAARQLELFARRLPRTRIAWILPIDLYSVLTWAEVLDRRRPRFIRPITGRVWPNVRGVAVWEWWPGHEGHTTVRPLRWR